MYPSIRICKLFAIDKHAHSTHLYAYTSIFYSLYIRFSEASALCGVLAPLSDLPFHRARSVNASIVQPDDRIVTP